jgi:hypothetical protein
VVGRAHLARRLRNAAALAPRRARDADARRPSALARSLRAQWLHRRPRDQEDRMSSQGDAHNKAGWLKILHDEDGSSWAYCPYREQVLGAAQCFGCKECVGLAIDPAARNDYVVCQRAERDGYSSSCSRFEASDGTVHLRTVLSLGLLDETEE